MEMVAWMMGVSNRAPQFYKTAITFKGFALTISPVHQKYSVQYHL